MMTEYDQATTEIEHSESPIEVVSSEKVIMLTSTKTKRSSMHMQTKGNSDQQQQLWG
jgi:hypothetical protein